MYQTAWDKMPSAERAEVIVSFRNHASKVLSLPGKIGEGVESCFEASCYHLRFCLYEKLLSSVFDVLEEGQIMEEANEILKLVKLTWPILGVSQIIHDVLYAWVLLKQFVKTDELLLLEKAILQVQQVLAAQPSDEKEIRYLSKLLCTIERDRRMIKLTLVPAILLSMRIWCGMTLEDYHRHYGQKPSAFSRVMTLELTMGDFVSDEYTEITKSAPSGEASVRRLKMYIERSVKATYDRASNYLDHKSESVNSTHPLVLLADALMLVAEKERNVFYPVLHQWYSDAGKFSATLLYQQFEERLKPFIEGISGLSQDVRSVLAASHMLDLQLTRLYAVAEGSSLNLSSGGELDHFQVARISSPLILDWIMGKHTDILQWIGRAFDLEDWEPVSSLQKQAVSIIEVFRMIDETVDQFFKLNLPVNTTHLQGLLSVIVHSLDAYLSKVTDQLVEKSHIYPPVPSLTRYEERVVAIVRKKDVGPAIFDKKVNYSMTGLTVSKLCTRLNTLQYVQDQVGVLEETIRKSWGAVKPSYGRRWFNVAEDDPSKMLGRTMDACNETVGELFVTTFDSIRNNAKDAMSKIYDIIGVTVVFWDLRNSFIYDLYRGSVEGSRIDHVLQKVDGVLNQICNLVDNAVRDAVVSSIFCAFVEGYVWVLLDGGPSRAFSENDITLLEDDLSTLKPYYHSKELEYYVTEHRVQIGGVQVKSTQK
ncbi:unc-13-like protein [Drosera capensis]